MSMIFDDVVNGFMVQGTDAVISGISNVLSDNMPAIAGTVIDNVAPTLVDSITKALTASISASLTGSNNTARKTDGETFNPETHEWTDKDVTLRMARDKEVYTCKSSVVCKENSRSAWIITVQAGGKTVKSLCMDVVRDMPKIETLYKKSGRLNKAGEPTTYTVYGYTRKPKTLDGWVENTDGSFTRIIHCSADAQKNRAIVRRDSYTK